MLGLLRSVVSSGDSDSESSTDDESLLPGPLPRRGRLTGVSHDDNDDDDDVNAPPASSSGVMAEESEPTVAAETTNDPTVVEASLDTGSSLVVELHSQAIPEPTTEPREFESQGEASPGAGLLRPEAAAAGSVVVVQAVVERQPLASADDS